MSDQGVELSRIRVLSRTGLKPAVIGKRPEYRSIKLHKLRINAAYQRQIGEKGVRLIRSMVENWDWAKFHAPVVVQITPDTGKDDDTYEVLDGQHTATGAASHGGIYEIPCQVAEAGTLVAKAEAFVGLNNNKINVTSSQKFWAAVTAQDEDALAVEKGCKQAGATVMKRPAPYGEYRVGECACPSTLLGLAKRGGSVYVKRVMEVAVACELAPVTKDFIRAFELLLLKDGPLKIEGSYQDVTTKISQYVRSTCPEDIVLAAQNLRHFDKDTMYRCMAFVIKRGIDELA